MREAALITGSAVRIGKEIALALADLGFDIALHYHRSKTEAIRTKEQIRNSGVDCKGAVHTVRAAFRFFSDKGFHAQEPGLAD